MPVSSWQEICCALGEGQESPDEATRIPHGNVKHGRYADAVHKCPGRTSTPPMRLLFPAH